MLISSVELSLRKVNTVVQNTSSNTSATYLLSGANNGELATDRGSNLVLMIHRLAPDFPGLVLTKKTVNGVVLVAALVSSSLASSSA